MSSVKMVTVSPAATTLIAAGADGAVVLPDTTIFGWLIVLRWRIEGESRVNSLPLFPDNVSTEEYRLLRICLRWSQHSALTEPAEID